MMRAVEITSFGAPEVLRLGERPLPVPGAGELRIRVAASGVNRPDVLQRLGHYAPPPGASDLPGLEVAGVIDAGDADALARAGLRVGDRVCALVAGGGYAEFCVAPVEQCLPVPEGLVSSHTEVGLPRYRRVFTLSKELDAEAVSAELLQGVLRLRIPKAAHAQPRRIDVQVH